MRCPKCGAENSPGLRFCEQCAAPLGVEEPGPLPVEAVPAPMQVCPICGAENPPGLRFCEQCAAPLAEVVPAAPRPRRARPRRRRLLAAAGIALLLLLMICCLFPYGRNLVRRAASHRPRISQREALRAAQEVVEERYPRFADATPIMEETEFGRDKGYHILYEVPSVEETDIGPVGFTRILLISINAVTGETSVTLSR